MFQFKFKVNINKLNMIFLEFALFMQIQEKSYHSKSIIKLNIIMASQKRKAKRISNRPIKMKVSKQVKHIKSAENLGLVIFKK
ncbi:hypothetical protein D9M68_833130 [compost metagenome]